MAPDFCEKTGAFFLRTLKLSVPTLLELGCRRIDVCLMVVGFRFRDVGLSYARSG